MMGVMGIWRLKTDSFLYIYIYTFSSQDDIYIRFPLKMTPVNITFNFRATLFARENHSQQPVRSF